MGIDNGVYNGINYYQNTGSINTAIFENYTPEFLSGDYDENGDEIITKSLGGIHLSDPIYLTGYTNPYIFEYNNIYHLAIGTESGLIYLYDNVENITEGSMVLNLETEYNLITENMVNINNCVHSKITISDINNDEFPDLIRGNASGGLELYLGANFNTNNANYSINNIKIHPNPNEGVFIIEKPNQLNYQLTIYSNVGHKILEKNIINQTTYINLGNLKKGVYIAHMKSEQTQFKTKIIVN